MDALERTRGTGRAGGEEVTWGCLVWEEGDSDWWREGREASLQSALRLRG